MSCLGIVTTLVFFYATTRTVQGRVFKGEDRPLHWIFIHYHKTGHDLARKLADTFSMNPCKAVVRYDFSRRVPISYEARNIMKTDVAVLAAPDMPISWNGHFLNLNDSDVRFVHFVRDPFDMIVSAYMYHAQEKMQPSERPWLTNSKFDPCKTDLYQTMHVFGTTMAMHQNEHSLHISSWINDSISTCRELRHEAQTAGAIDYHTMLRTLSREKGLILEATRSLLSDSGGDILRMAANAVFESKTNSSTSERVQVFLSDFPISDLEMFRATCTHLFAYLMRMLDYGDKIPFWSCANQSQAVERAIKFVYIDTKSDAMTADKSLQKHITQDKVSASDRSKLMHYLKDYRSVGPLLTLVYRILSSK